MSQSSSSTNQSSSHTWYLTLGALGVVYGDIGTSPLYAMKECFSQTHGAALTEANILGVLSLIVWSLIITISVKYVAYVLRADNQGEGGVLALLALVTPVSERETAGVSRKAILFIGLFGAALLYGDGMITPAISVLSAVEGLKIETPLFEPYIIPITIVILFGLFFVQSRGSGGLGAMFGPIILIWFACIGTLGLIAIIKTPAVMRAFSPGYGVDFFLTNGWHGFIVLGSVFLAVTGGEALYADMGHFGRVAIRRGWLGIALPALLLNYFGQGALLLSDPSAVENPFYHLAPPWALLGMVIIAAMATIIASQAVISGAFSLTFQAVQLGYLPRLSIDHTSDEEIGQIYVGTVNWALLIATVWLVLEFRTSSNLAAAYGIAVSTTMVLTTILMHSVTRKVWKWPKILSFAVTGLFLIFDFSFFLANVIKIEQGGWVPVVLAVIIFTIMTTWKRGRIILGDRLREVLPPAQSFIGDIQMNVPSRVSGTAIFMVRSINTTPTALIHNVRHNKVIHDCNILLQVMTEKVPHVRKDERAEILDLGDGFFTMVLRFGFNDNPDVPEALRKVDPKELYFDISKVTFFLGRETVIPTERPGMAIWRETLFAFMSRNAQAATTFFNIPPNQVVEIGLQVEI